MISIKRLGGKYYLDLDRYISFISDVTTSERLTNSVITSTYSDDLQSNDGDMSMLTKEIVETKGNGGGNELFHQIRYEIIKNLVVSLTSGGYTVDGEISVDDGASKKASAKINSKGEVVVSYSATERM